MPDKTYILRFTHSDSSEIEEFEHTRESDAREHLALFGIEDADIYRRIDLIGQDGDTETLLDSRIFCEDSVMTLAEWRHAEQVAGCKAHLRQALQLGYTCGTLQRACVDLAIDRFGIETACEALDTYGERLTRNCEAAAVQACRE